MKVKRKLKQEIVTLLIYLKINKTNFLISCKKFTISESYSTSLQTILSIYVYKLRIQIVPEYKEIK